MLAEALGSSTPAPALLLLRAQAALLRTLARLAHLAHHGRPLSTSTASGSSSSGAEQPGGGWEAQRLRPVQDFFQEQVASGALQPDESQAAAAVLLDGVFRSMGQQLSTPAAAVLAAPEGAPGEAAAAAAGSGGASAVGPHSAPPVPHGSATAAAPVRVEQPTAAAQQPQQAQRPQQEAALQGAYLWGEVGSGKTLLMNAYHRASESLLPSPAAQQAQQAQRAPDVQQSTATSRAAVRRTHFHAFMVDVHKRLHDLHQRVPRVAGKSRQGLPVFRYAPILEDPVKLVGHQLAQEAQLLCLDELHVTDVADALILNKLFGAILERGSWVLFTSNRPPQDLYRGGLSRKYFEPFIHLVSRRLQVIRVGSGIDYRHVAQHAQQEGADAPAAGAGEGARGLRLVGRGEETGPRLRQEWERWLAQHGLQAAPAKLSVGFGRELQLPVAAWRPEGLAAYLTFDQLCGRHGIEAHGRQLGAALGPADFIALASHVKVLFLEGVPLLTPAKRDEARRFLTLVDALYDYGAQLHCSMEGGPRDLFLPLLAAAKAQGVDPNLAVAAATAVEVPNVSAPGPEDRDPEDRTTRATLEEEVLMYRRAMSRLQEMTREA